MADKEFANWHEFAKACPLLAMAAAVVDWEGDPQGEGELWALIRTATDSRFRDAEAELAKLTAAQFREVVYTDPGVQLEFAPVACSVLTAMFA